jgi:hypothetical protein
MMELIKQSLNEDSKVSSMRIMSYCAVVGTLGVWAIQNIASIVSCLIRGCTISTTDIPANVLILVGSVIGGKVIQKFGEKQNG